MSDRLPSPSPAQGSFSQFQVNATQTPSQQPRNPRREALMKLYASIPKTDEEWRAARQRNSFNTREDIYRTVSALIQDGLLPSDLRRLIYIAVCCVDHSKDEAKAYRKYRTRVNAKDLAEFTIRNYMSLVRGIVALIDELYLKVQHRAFEAFLLYAPLSLGALAHYKKDPEGVKACFIKSEVGPEVQASIVLYLPSIVAARHPEHRYNEVCKALGTSVRGEEEHYQFLAALASLRLVPRTPADSTTSERSTSLPGTRGRYDPIRDAWRHVTISSLIGYKSFSIQGSTQQLVAAASKHQDECIRQEVPTAVIFRYKWSPNHHGMASYQVVTDLKRAGIISDGIIEGTHVFLRHESGSMTVPNGWQQIIIPAVVLAEKILITLRHQGDEENIVWDSGRVLLLSPGTTLSTSSAIFYFSIALPLPPQ